MNKQETTMLPAMGKGELAQRYLPNLAPHSALNMLSKWMTHHPLLMEELRETGYRPRQKLLTPRQVEIVVKHLGEP